MQRGVVIFAVLVCLAGGTPVAQHHGAAKRGRKASHVREHAHRSLEEFGDPQHVFNIGVYVGSGYDMYYGNPMANGVDPGFRASIFDLNSFEEGKTTADKRHVVPDGAELKQCSSCTTDFSSKMMTSMKSYQEELATTVEVSAGAKGAEFSASVGFKNAKSSIEESKETIIEAKAECCIYVVHALLYDRPYFTTNFENAVAEMSELTEMSDDERNEYWDDFFREFGTHLVLTTKMGGRQGRREKVTSEEIRNAEESGTSIGAKVAYNAGQDASVGVGVNRDETKRKEELEAKANEKAETFSVGGVYKADREAWMENLREEPMPIGIPDIRPLPWLLSPRMFPDDPNIYKKQAHLKKAFDERCGVLQARGALDQCAIRVEDEKMPVFMGMFFAHGAGTHNGINPWSNTPGCPPGTTTIDLFEMTRAGGSHGTMKWCIKDGVTLEKVMEQKPRFGGLFKRSLGAHELRPFPGAHMGAQHGRRFGGANNPITDAESCPPGYKEQDYPVENERQSSAAHRITMCYLPGTPDAAYEVFGGIFVRASAPQFASLATSNPMSGSVSCSMGYKEHKVAESVHGSFHQDVDYYVCKRR